mmetsp:Transcript_5402/g.15987  ORF Transcript_5402/g.15987 Transcript_5402/m.15987 type:complete len:473 (-) Transcript_5402:40-1458(-)
MGPATTAAMPFPYKQIAVILAIQIAEAINGMVLFPFLTFMLRDLGVSERRLGMYSGLVGASFFLGQVLSSYHWGRAADRFGEKRCIVFGCLATAMTSVLFAFSRSVAWAVAARLLCGLLNGMIGIVKSYVTKLTDANTRPRAFAMMPIGFGLGIVLASELGGALSNPRGSWPGVFAGWFWRRYPYALPLLVGAAYQLVMALLAQLVLIDASSARAEYAAVGKSDDAVAEPVAVAPVWRRRGPVLSCLAYALMAGAQIFFDELFPLYARGCVGWRPHRIGVFLSCGGTAVVIGGGVAPRVIRAFGGANRKAFCFANALSLPLGLVVPALLKWGPLFATFFSMRVCQTVGFTAVMLMVNTSAPVSEIGAVNGFGQSLAALVRAAGPLVGGTSWSGALELARRGGAEVEACPGLYAYVPYGARGFMVLLSLAAAACIPRAPLPDAGDSDEEECKAPEDPDAAEAFVPSEDHVEMV